MKSTFIKSLFFYTFFSGLFFAFFWNPTLVFSETKLKSEDYKLQQAQKDIGNWDEKSAKPDSSSKKNISKSNKAKSNKAKEKKAKEIGIASDAKKNIKSEKKQEDSNKDALSSDKKGRVSFWGTLFKTLVVLILLGSALYYFIRFIAKKQGFEVIGRDVVEVLAMVPIGPGKFIQIVDIAGKVLVLGVSDAGINLISEITNKDDIDKILLSKSKSSVGDKPNFLNILVERFKGKINLPASSDLNKSASSSDRDEFKDLIAKQRERLEKLKND